MSGVKGSCWRSLADGATRWAEPLVLGTGRLPGELLVRLPVELPLTFDGLGPVRWSLLLGDVLEGQTGDGGAYRVAFADHHTLLGEVPPGVVVRAGNSPLSVNPSRLAGVGSGDLVGWHSGGSWGLAWRTPQDGGLAALPIRPDMNALGRARTAFVRSLAVPEHLSPDRVRLLRKALSVMKLNVHSANGTIRRRWSTPDRGRIATCGS